MKRILKKTPIIAGLIILGLAIIMLEFIIPVLQNANQEFTGLPSRLVQFTSSSGDIVMLYPENWDGGEGKIRGEEDGIAHFSSTRSATFLPEVTIYKKVFETEELDAIVTWRKSTLFERGVGDSDITTENIQLVNRSAILFEYTRAVDQLFDGTIHCYEVMTMSDQSGYVFSFCALADQWDLTGEVFMQMIRSIEINGE